MKMPENLSFDKMTKNEAKFFFEYYISQSDERINYLKDYIQREGKNITFDYSPDSLVMLWNWYEKKITIIDKTKEEFELQCSKYPKWMQDYISKEKVSNETLKIALDISFYFAEVVIRNNKEIKWGIFTSPASRMSVNQPTLLGFSDGIDLNPRLIVLNCIRKSARNKNERNLFDLYNTWMKYI